MTGSVQTFMTDVLVIGGGASGLAAGIEAARRGSKVILIEQAAELGGMMNWCVGTVSAVNTPGQKQLGITDTTQAHFEDLATHASDLAPRDNLVLRRLLTDNTTDMMNWLLDLGIVFAPPMIDPPQRVARMHNVVPSSQSFAFHMERACKAAGVDIRLGTRCQNLIEANGRVVGVTAQRSGVMEHYIANHGVILATGDYSGASDLKAAFGKADVANVEPVAATSTGDGYRFGMALGGTVANGDIVRGPIMRFVPPREANFIQKIPPFRIVGQAITLAMRVMPQFLLRPFLMKFLTTVLGPSPELFKSGAVLINQEGRRFTDELRGPAAAVAKQPGKNAYIVFDQALATKFSGWPHFVSTAPGIAYAYIDDYRRCRKDIFHSADTADELARQLNMPPAELAAALAQYNESERGERAPLTQGPFYALGPVRSYVVFTEGGLRVTERLEVLRENGSAIEGLYAVGSTGQGGVLLEGHGHHLGWAFISGRIAGATCAANPHFDIPAA
jgi:succinate dehydrogenase/fumarate reductase flavoprotein subunit